MPGITNPAEPYFKDGVWGWDGSAWHKLPMLFGYSDVWSEVKNSLNVAAGDLVVYFDTIDPGQVVVVTNFNLRCAQNNATWVELRAVIDGTIVALKAQGTIVANDSVSIQCHVVLKEGDKLGYRYVGATLNDDFHASACGYVMEIAE